MGEIDNLIFQTFSTCVCPLLSTKPYVTCYSTVFFESMSVLTPVCIFINGFSIIFVHCLPSVVLNYLSSVILPSIFVDDQSAIFKPPKINLNQPQVKLSPVILNSLLEKHIQPQINFFFHHIFVTFTPLFNSYDLKSTLTIGFSFQTEWVSLSV